MWHDLLYPREEVRLPYFELLGGKWALKSQDLSPHKTQAIIINCGQNNCTAPDSVSNYYLDRCSIVNLLLTRFSPFNTHAILECKITS